MFAWLERAPMQPRTCRRIRRTTQGRNLLRSCRRHIAIELATLADTGANHGKTRHSGEPRIYNIAVEYKAEHASRYLLEAAVRLVSAVLNSETFALGKEIWEAKQIAVRTELGPSTRAIDQVDV